MRATLALLLFLSVPTVVAVPLEESFSPFDSGRDEVGVRALGLGGAYLALADDLTATEWNPAGLAVLKGFHVQCEGSSFRHRDSGDIYRFKHPWDLGYTVLIPPRHRGASIQADYLGAGTSWGRGDWNLFSAVSWARTRDGRRDERMLDPVTGIERGVRQSGGIYHVTVSHAAAWKGKWRAGVALHGLCLGGLEGVYTETGQPEVAFAKIFHGDPSLDAGVLIRPFPGTSHDLGLGFAYRGSVRMTFNYSDAWTEDFDADYLQTARFGTGLSWFYRNWTVSFQWERDFDSALNTVRKSNFTGRFPAIEFPIEYFDVDNVRVGVEWRPAVRWGPVKTLSIGTGYATRDRGYRLRTGSFLPEDEPIVASFGRPLGSMLTWGLAAESPRWIFRLSVQSGETRYERSTRTLQWRFGIGVKP